MATITVEPGNTRVQVTTTVLTPSADGAISVQSATSVMLEPGSDAQTFEAFAGQSINVSEVGVDDVDPELDL